MILKKSHQNLFIILLFIACPGIKAYTQRNFRIEDAKQYPLKEIKSTSRSGNRLPFKEIIVKDYRFDTTKLGYLGYTRFYKIVVEGNTSDYFTREINKYYKNNLTATAEKSLVIILKSLWLQKTSEEEYTKNKLVTKDAYAYSQEGICFANLEAFVMSNGNYQALSRIESAFHTSVFNKWKLDDLLLAPFDSLFRKIAALDTDSILSKKRNYPETEVYNNYLNRFDVPVLTNIPQKGVFMSFDDFRNNKTVHPDYVLKQSKLSTELYIINSGKEELLNDFWGIYDGTDHYIRLGFSLFRLTRQNNTFDLYGTRYVTHRKSDWTYWGSSSFPAFQIKTKNAKLEKSPLQLNMENGEVF